VVTKYDPRFRRTKIVATLGPASGNAETVGRMIEAGADVFRVNSSHGTPDRRRASIDLVRQVAEERGRHIGILVDLQGPRIRVGALEEPRRLDEGSIVVFAPESDATGDEIPTTYEALANDVAPGGRILLDDGILRVDVQEIRGTRVHGRVYYGGLLKGQKGMNLPDAQISVPAVTQKDREDIVLAVDKNVEYIGISFVSRASDVHEVRGLVPAHVRLVAKIERAAALAQVSEILQAADAVMVARGDLGVELPYEEVPLEQKRLISQANHEGRAVITATQMLESMIESPRPTRAEVSDVANAILDGTDAVMLSAETAVGAYPVEAVAAMASVIREIERSLVESSVGVMRRRRIDVTPEKERKVEDAIALATTAAAEMLNAPAIVTFTKSGFTARKIALHRPKVPILALSTELTTCRQLALVWGVMPAFVESVPTYDAMLGAARIAFVEHKVGAAGDLIVVTAGVPFEVPGTTNLLKVEIV
jgi:pyruvate kinase